MTAPPFIAIPKHVDRAALFAAAERLEARLNTRLPDITAALSRLPDPAGTSGYWPQWFARKMPNVLSYLQVYAYIIGNAVPKGVQLRDVRLLDYGGGWGLMGMLAKEAGVGSVTYLDISPGVAAAAQAVATAAGLPLDRYLCGDETVLHRHPERFNAVVSSDVLEHVYDPDRVFRAIAVVCAPGARVFHQTGANPKSLHQRLTLTKLHRAEEPKLRAVRSAIIAEQGIAGADRERLATATRGLDRADLDSAIVSFKATGALPTPDHPTNTCELSGYWLERLMDPYEVARKMERAGFRAGVRQSFWGPGRSHPAVRAAKHGLNLLSRLSVQAGLRATFYYGVHGVMPAIRP